MTTTPAARLGPGELRRQVAAYLAEHRDRDRTPAEIARALGGRSTGAIGNALKALVDQGDAAHCGTRPNRYRATDSTASAATPATPRSAPPGRIPASTGSSPAPGGTVPVRGPVRRPNGQTYHPRSLADLPDVAALRRLRDAGIPALLYGPPGTGKTSLVEAAFPDLITVAGDGDTAVADFIGEHAQAGDGRYEFVHGPLVNAMVEGRCLFIDDATLISPKVLAVVYPAMDGRRQIAVKAHKGEIVTAAPGFYVIVGHNSPWTELREFPEPPAGRSSGSWMVRSRWLRGTSRCCRSRRLAAFVRDLTSGSPGSCSTRRAFA